MLLFLVLMFLVGACYHGKSWKQVLRNIVIAELILIAGLVVTLYLTTRIEQSADIHVHSAEALARLFISNVFLQTFYVVVLGFGAYAFRKVFARRDVASLSPDDETPPLIKYWKTGTSFAVVAWAVSCIIVGLALLYIAFRTWTNPLPWTDGDHEFFPWVLGFGVAFFLAGGAVIARKFCRWWRRREKGSA